MKTKILYTSKKKKKKNHATSYFNHLLYQILSSHVTYPCKILRVNKILCYNKISCFILPLTTPISIEASQLCRANIESNNRQESLDDY